MVRLLIACSALCLTACVPPAAAEEPLAVPIASVPDLTTDLPRGKCDHGPGVAGADSIYTGDLTIADDKVEGVERWHLFKNTKWHAKEAKDCVVIWNVVGSPVDPETTCPGCDVAIHAVADVDFDKTTCHQNLWSERGTRRFVVDYGVDKKPDGTATVYYNHGGQKVADGNHGGNRVVYRSAHRCVWF